MPDWYLALRRLAVLTEYIRCSVAEFQAVIWADSEEQAH